MVALFWKVQQPGRREGGRACVKERGPDEREPGGSRRRKETRSGTRGEQLCIKLKQATSEAFPWHYARRPMRFARADTRVSHDCRCCVHGTTCLPIKPHQRYHEPGTSWMHLEKPLAFLQPERERERHAWELRNLDGEFFSWKQRVEISSLACSFLSKLSRLLATRVVPLFDRVFAANAPSFFFSLSIAEDTSVLASGPRPPCTPSSRYSQYGGLAG